MQNTIEQIFMRRYGRRALLSGAVKIAGAGIAFSVGGCTETELFVDHIKEHIDLPGSKGKSSLTFDEVSRGSDPRHHLPAHYLADTLIRWGDPLFADTPTFNPAAQTPSKQTRQFGYNNDYTAYFSLGKGVAASRRGLLCVNHEFTRPELMFPGEGRLDDDQLRIEQAAHGISVVEILRSGQNWRTVFGEHNRRITATTPIALSGPAAGHPRLRTRKDNAGLEVLGTLANCAGGQTPWGTYLSCEENIDGYFVNPPGFHRETTNHRRMGIGKNPWYEWHRIDPRFDSTYEPNEPNRFGWVVELDPYNPDHMPIKRTALGRFKHEAATTILTSDDRVAVYMGDDEAFEYVYRYVSAAAYDPHDRASNSRLLDEGTLYAARFHADGLLEWLPLVYGQGPLTKANGFFSQADVLIETRRAAELMGATPMDRPEDVEVNPLTGKLYIVMTKNEARKETDAANPRAGNRFGHIIEVIPSPPGQAGAPWSHGHRHMQWNLFLAGGDPSVPVDRAIYPESPSDAGWLACPDNIAFDPQGRLWIATDGQSEASGNADGLYACDTFGRGKGLTRHFFRAPRGAEVCGPSFTPDGTTLFLAIQHPGSEEGSRFANPSTRWPDFDPSLPPRPAIIAVRREDDGIIGS